MLAVAATSPRPVLEHLNDCLVPGRNIATAWLHQQFRPLIDEYFEPVTMIQL